MVIKHDKDSVNDFAEYGRGSAVVLLRQNIGSDMSLWSIMQTYAIAQILKNMFQYYYQKNKNSF